MSYGERQMGYLVNGKLYSDVITSGNTQPAKMDSSRLQLQKPFISGLLSLTIKVCKIIPNFAGSFSLILMFYK